MKFLRSILVVICFCYLGNTYSQYRIKKVISDTNYYYNGIIYDNKLLIGSASGILELKENEFYYFDEIKLKGPISFKNNTIVNGRLHETSQELIKLLPPNYQSTSVCSLKTDREILLFSKGAIFIFDKINLKFEPKPSVRSISKNYIGTYGGIFNVKNEILKYPTYTNGYIREIDEQTFICWDGLSVIDNNKNIVNYTDTKTKEVLIGNKLLGRARDIIKLDNETFLLFSSKGLYTVNLKNQTSDEILATNDYLSVCYYEEDLSGNNLVYFAEENKLYMYDVLNKNLENLYTSGSPILKAIRVNSTDSFYILSTDGLKTISFSNNSISENLIYAIDDLPNDMVEFQNNLFILKDSGLDIYNAISNKYIRNAINDEFNRKAYYKQKEKLFLGSVNGIYTLDKDHIQSLIFKPNTQIKKSVNDLTFLENTLLVITGLLSMSFLFLFFKVKNSFDVKRKKKVKDHSDLREIEEFIDDNISSVNINILCDKFDMHPKTLYEVMNKQKPGELIRKKRIALVKKMRKEKSSEKEISDNTGFSVNYLRTIK